MHGSVLVTVPAKSKCSTKSGTLLKLSAMTIRVRWCDSSNSLAFRVGKIQRRPERRRLQREALDSGYPLDCVGDTQPIVEFTFRNKRR
jgi:hypothetical protein